MGVTSLTPYIKWILKSPRGLGLFNLISFGLLLGATAANRGTSEH